MKIFMIGIDSLDRRLISRFIDKLPNFKRLELESPTFRLMSVYPPDSSTCWASIYTSWNPARHNIFFFSDVLENVAMASATDLDNKILRGNTFWDIASAKGKKVCVVFPHLGYPVWPVNGVMIGRSPSVFVRDSIQSYPPGLTQNLRDTILEPIKEYPDNPAKFVKPAERLIDNETNVALRLYRESDWDLFFMYSSVLDFISHNFWNYFDQSDPSFKPDNQLTDVIPKFYKLYDGIVGRCMDALKDDTAIVVMSDHGHGLRPMRIVNVNILLRNMGLLNTHHEHRARAAVYYPMEVMKSVSTRIINRYRIGGNFAMRILKRFEAIRHLFTTSWMVDWDHTVAYVTDMSGIKAYTYGGIRILKERISERGYNEICDSIIHMLQSINVPHSDFPLVKWVTRRDNLYQGPFLERYPDIVFEFVEGYGIGHRTEGEVFSTSYSHNIHPGGHKADSAVLYITKYEGKPKRLDVNLLDIAPTILHILGIAIPEGLDGSSVYL